MDEKQKSISIKRLKRLIFAQRSFDEVIALCDHLQKHNITPDDPIYAPCVGGITVTYMKNFVESNGMRPLPAEFEKFNDPQLQHTHNLLKKSRHKLYAHRDVKAATTFKFDNSTSALPYEISVELSHIKTRRLTFYPNTPHLNPEAGYYVKVLCILQNERAAKEINLLMVPLIEAKKYKAGRYVLGKNFP